MDPATAGFHLIVNGRAVARSVGAGADRKLTSNEEALLIATACSSPPILALALALSGSVRGNRRDFRGSEIARHFRSLCAESRSLRSGCHVQATLLGASRPKSLAANFRFQSCYAARGGAARSQVATRGKHWREENPSKGLSILRRKPAPGGRAPPIGPFADIRRVII
jgi:hypothetical protein